MKSRTCNNSLTNIKEKQYTSSNIINDLSKRIKSLQKDIKRLQKKINQYLIKSILFMKLKEKKFLILLKFVEIIINL